MPNKFKQFIWEWRGVLIAAPSVAGIVILLRVLGLLQPLEWAAFDQFFRWRPQESVDQRILIVGIDEVDVRNAKQWPLSDATLAELINKLKAQKPRAIGLDVVRDLPVEPGHADLVRVFKTTPNLFGAEKIADFGDPKNTFGNASSAIAPPPDLKALGQVGSVNFVVDSDGKVRRGLISIAEDRQNQILLSLGMQLSLLYLNAEPTIPFPEAIEKPPRFQSNDGGYINADSGGHQILLNYRRAAFPNVPMRDVLENRVPPDMVRDRVVLIGVTATSLKDYFATPLSGGVWTDYTQMPGVEVHAHLVSQLLSTALNGRGTIQTWNDEIEYLWIVLWSIIGALLSWNYRSSNAPKLSSQSDRQKQKFLWRPSPGVIRSTSLGTAVASLAGISYWAFISGWWIPVVPALLGLGGTTIAINTYLAHTASKIRACFSRYLTDAVVSSILETPEGMRFGGDRRTVTILMSDLRGFSSISERLDPEEVVEILNIFLGQMTEVINRYQGTIDEFIGDAILVIFGAPVAHPDHATRAIACAIDMQRNMDEVNRQLNVLKFPNIAMGIGVNTGEVVVGNIGSDTRAKYAVVGSNVNLTGRIESYTVGGQILISEATLKDAIGDVRIDGQLQVEPKGVKEPITIYDIGGISGQYNVSLPVKNKSMSKLNYPIEVEYRILDGKYLKDETYHGKLTELSPTSGKLITNEALEPFTNIKIYLTNHLGKASTSSTEHDFYAKVLKNPQTEDSKEPCIYIYFTIMAPEIEDWLQKIYKESLVAEAKS